MDDDEVGAEVAGDGIEILDDPVSQAATLEPLSHRVAKLERLHPHAIRIRGFPRTSRCSQYPVSQCAVK